MNTRIGLICILALAFVSVLPETASARGRNRASNAAYVPVSQPVFGQAPATIIPRPAEIATLPRAQDGRMLPHPVDIVRYPLNLHPGLRAVRMVIYR